MDDILYLVVSHLPLQVTVKLHPKVTCLSIQSTKTEAGHVYLPNEAEWLEAFQAELMEFPQGRHDDQVDPLPQFPNWIDQSQHNQVHMVRLTGL